MKRLGVWFGLLLLLGLLAVVVSRLWLLMQPMWAFNAVFRLEFFFLCPLLAVTGCALCFQLRTWRRRLPCMLGVIATAGSLVLLGHYNVPLRVGFLLSESELSRVANAVRAQPLTPYRGRAGSYEIRSTHLAADNAVLSLTEGGLSGWGFIHSIGVAAPESIIAAAHESKRRGYEHDVAVARLGAGWYVYYSRYVSVKVWWS